VDGARELVMTVLDDGTLPGFEPVLNVLTNLGGRRVGSPSWTGDGTRIVFSSDADGDEDIYVINADGTSLAKLTDNEGVDRDPVWSPDGRTIVFASDRDGVGQTELYSMRPNGQGVTPLTDAAGSSFQPAWSADGRFIAFVSDRRRDADLYIMRADGSDEQLLTRDDGDAEDRAPAWSPDGRWIAFSSNRDGTYFRIYLIDPISERLLSVTDEASDDFDVAWLSEVLRR
jgi:Tol biopolymer transport system component